MITWDHLGGATAACSRCRVGPFLAAMLARYRRGGLIVPAARPEENE